MKKGWKQTWKNLLFQHFELSDTTFLQVLLPKNCKLDDFNGKYYLGLVAMNMTNVRHRAFENFVWFKSYNELNVRTYITLDNKPGVLFLSLDVDSVISVLGARGLYGLPYRYRNFEISTGMVTAFNGTKESVRCEYEIEDKDSSFAKDSFAYWATERYFFASKYLGRSFTGNIMHKPWHLTTAKVRNHNLTELDKYPIAKQHPDMLFCDRLDVTTSKLYLI